MTWEWKKQIVESDDVSRDVRDTLWIGTGTLAGDASIDTENLPARDFGSVQVVWTAGAVTGQIVSSNDLTNWAVGYDEYGVVRPALFTALAASRNFDNPRFPAYRANRLRLTAGAAGFTGTVLIYMTRRGK